MLDISRGHPMLNLGIQSPPLLNRIARRLFHTEDLTDIVTVNARASVPLSMRRTGDILALPWISDVEREVRFAVLNNDCCDCCGKHLNRITRSQSAPCLCESCNNELENDYRHKRKLPDLPLAVSPEIHNLLPSSDIPSVVFSFNWREQRLRRSQQMLVKKTTRVKLLKRKLIKYLNKLEDILDEWRLHHKYKS